MKKWTGKRDTRRVVLSEMPDRAMLEQYLTERTFGVSGSIMVRFNHNEGRFEWLNRYETKKEACDEEKRET
jgi:hypothetical protein